MLRIDTAPLGPGTHALDLAPQAQALELDPETFSDLHVDVRLERQRDRVLVAFTARAVASLHCDRTLRPFEQPVEGSYGLLFAPPDTAPPPDEDDAYEEVHPWPLSETKLDITDAVRDTLLLALPQRQVAPGAEEADLETTYGAPDGEEEAIDPRWEKLRALKGD